MRNLVVGFGCGGGASVRKSAELSAAMNVVYEEFCKGFYNKGFYSKTAYRVA